MEQYTGFSAHASLATIGLWMQAKEIWKQVEEQVVIKQKTLNACTEINIKQLEAVARKVYQEFGQGYRHGYEKGYLLLDIDLTGLLAGQQAEGSSKGYFAGSKNARGRQLGRVIASQYDEIACEQLYDGKVQLEKCLIGLIEMAENVLDLDETRRKHTILRVDGGGGTDGNINWVVLRDYFWMSKVKNWQRTSKLVAPISEWQSIPELPGHEIAWVPIPHEYEQPLRQLAVRWPKPKKDGWHYCVLVFNLSNEMIFEVAGRAMSGTLTELELLATILKAYNLRSGGVETSFKNSKQGLGLNKRNKKSFVAQQMLVLLAQLAYNITTWVRTELAKHKPEMKHFGMLRMIRDVFSISGKIHFDEQGHLLQVVLNQTHGLAKTFYESWHPIFARDDLSLILGEI